MAIRVQRHANVSKHATLLDGLDVSPLKWRMCGCGLNRFVHEGMNHISNVEVHLKTRSGNVNIQLCTQRCYRRHICKPLVVYRFYCMALFHSQMQRFESGPRFVVQFFVLF